MALGYLISPAFQYENINGKPLVGGRITVRLHGTTTPYITYKDWNGDHNPAEIVLNDKGMAVIIADDSKLYDVYCVDANGVEQWSRLNVSVGQGGGGGGGTFNLESTDGTIICDPIDGGFDLSVNIGDVSVVECSSEALDGAGPFVISTLKRLQGDAIELDTDNSCLKLKKGWYHVDVEMIVQNQLDRNDMYGAVITDSLSNFHGQYNIDLSLTDQQSLPVSYDLYVANDDTLYRIIQGSSTQYVRYYLTNLTIHTITAGVSGNGGGISGNGIEFVNTSDNSATVSAIIARGNWPVLKLEDPGARTECEPLCNYIVNLNKYCFGRIEWQGAGDFIYFCGHVLDGTTDMWSGYSKFVATTDDLSGKIDKVTGASGGEVALVNSDGSLTTGPHVSSLAYTGMLAAYQPLSAMSGYATTGDLTGKMDASASSNFYPMTGNPSGFLTGVDLSPYQPVSGMSGYATTGDLAAKQDASSMSSYVPYSSFGYNSDSQISGINGSAIAGAGVTGDYVEKSAISAESATWNTVTAKQDISGMSGYATTGDLAGKLDASASSDFYPMTGNPSSFLTEHQDISTKLDTSAFTAYTATALSGLENDVTGISAAVSGITGLTGTYVEQSAFNDYSAGVGSALGDKLDVTAYDSAKYPSVYWPYGLAQTTGQLLLQESRYPKYVQALVSGTGETASAGIIPPIPSSNLTSVRVLAADSGSLPNVSWIDYEPGYPTSNPSGFITSQVVTSTATQLYAGTAYLTSVNGTPISASRAGQAANATLATTAWYDSEGRAISSLAATNDLTAYIPTSVSSQFLTSETVTATAGEDGYITSINGSGLSGAGGGGGGGTYSGIAPVVVDNDAMTIGLNKTGLAVDSTMTSYSSGDDIVLGVSTAGLVSDGFLTSVDLTPYQTTAGMSAYAFESSNSAKLDATAFSTVSGNFLTSQTVTALGNDGTYITSINGSGISGVGGGATGDYVEKSSISAESANWNDTYSAVSSNSASWAAPAFPLEISTGSTVKAVVTTGFQDNTSTRPTLFISSNPSQTAYPRMLLSENRTGAVTNKSSTYLADAFEFYSAANSTAAGTKIFRADPTVISGSQLTAAVGKGWRIGSAEYDLWNGASAMSSKQDVSGMSAYVEKSAKTVAIGSAEALNTSLAQGDGVTASYLSFAQGSGVSAYYYSLAQGKASTSDTYSLAQGYSAIARFGSLAQGSSVSASGRSLAQGSFASATDQSLAQGYSAIARFGSLAQGSSVSASGRSLAQGYSSFADGTSLAQGDHTTAGSNSLAQGYSARATDQSFAQGDLVTATVGSFAQGSGVQAYNWAFAHGKGVTASASATVFGTFNLKGNGSADNVSFTIGDGTAASDRHDLLNVFRDGEITTYSSTSDTTGFAFRSAIQAKQDSSAMTGYATTGQLSNKLDISAQVVSSTAGSGQHVTSINGSAIKSDETVLWTGTSYMASHLTLELSEPAWNFECIDIYVLPHSTNTVPCVERFAVGQLTGSGYGSITVMGHAGGGGVRFNNAQLNIDNSGNFKGTESRMYSIVGTSIQSATAAYAQYTKIVGINRKPTA